MRYLVVNTRTEVVLSRHATVDEAEAAMLATDPKPHTGEFGSVDLAVADDSTIWRWRCDLCGERVEELNQRCDIQQPTTCSGGPFRCAHICNACDAKHPDGES